MEPVETIDRLPLDEGDINIESLKQPFVVEKISSINACMAAFTLSPTSQPDWAMNVDEVKWKQHL